MIGYNLYAYCEKNPVKYWDPTGQRLEAALGGWMSSMWWLNGVDGPLPIGDAVFWSVTAILGIAVVGEIIYVAATDSPDVRADEKTPADTAPTPEVDEKGNPVVKPGQIPTEKEGYIAPPNGPEWTTPKNGKKSGWKDKNGNIWIPVPTGSKNAHGGGHWDVQSPKGGYTNVYPDGKIREGKKPFPHIYIVPR